MFGYTTLSLYGSVEYVHYGGSRQIKSISLFQQRMKAFLAKCDNANDIDRSTHRTPENCVNVYILHLQLLSYWILKREWIEMKISPCFTNYKVRNKFVDKDDDDNNSDVDDTQKVDFVCANLEDYKFLELIFYCSLFALILSPSLSHSFHQSIWQYCKAVQWFVFASLICSLLFSFSFYFSTCLFFLLRVSGFSFHFQKCGLAHAHPCIHQQKSGKRMQQERWVLACTNTQRSAHVNVVFSRHRFTSVELCDFIVSAFVSHGEKFIINAATDRERYLCCSACVFVYFIPNVLRFYLIRTLVKSRKFVSWWDVRASVRKLSSNRLCKAAARRHFALRSNCCL